jgi:hypothetical protein
MAFVILVIGRETRSKLNSIAARAARVATPTAM